MSREFTNRKRQNRLFCYNILLLKSNFVLGMAAALSIPDRRYIWFIVKGLGMVKIVRWAKMAVLAAAMSVGTAHAAFINGSLAASDGGLTLPGLPSTSIVSQLNIITQGSPVAANNCMGDFGTSVNCFGIMATTSTIDILAQTGIVHVGWFYVYDHQHCPGRHRENGVAWQYRVIGSSKRFVAV